jgi:small subunit ribosomal protein S7
MSKKATASIEQLKPDPKFNSKLAGKFINCLMWQGKKSVAQNIFYEAMDIIAEKEKSKPLLEIFETAINNVKPMIEVRSKRVGGASYQVPMQVSAKRQQSLAIRWVLDAARMPGGGAARGLSGQRRRYDDKGKRAQNGRGQQGVRAFRVVI